MAGKLRKVAQGLPQWAILLVAHGTRLWQDGHVPTAAALAIFLSFPAICVKSPPCLSWHVAIDKTEISRQHTRSISADVDAFSELWRCLYCLGSP